MRHHSLFCTQELGRTAAGKPVDLAKYYGGARALGRFTHTSRAGRILPPLGWPNCSLKTPCVSTLFRGILRTGVRNSQVASRNWSAAVRLWATSHRQPSTPKTDEQTREREGSGPPCGHSVPLKSDPSRHPPSAPVMECPIESSNLRSLSIQRFHPAFLLPCWCPSPIRREGRWLPPVLRWSPGIRPNDREEPVPQPLVQEILARIQKPSGILN